MNIENVLEKFPNTIASDWHRHTNGGGWIFKNATVADTVFVSSSAVVAAYATVHGRSSIVDEAVVSDHATVIDSRVKDRATVNGHAYVLGGSIIGDDAVVSGHAKLRGAWVYRTAIIRGSVLLSQGHRVRGGDWTTAPLYIVGTMAWDVGMVDKTHFAIGCEAHTFQEWRRIQGVLERKHGMTPEQCKEYRAYLDLAELLYGDNAAT